MKKIFYLFITSLFFISLANGTFAKDFFGKNTATKQIKVKTLPSRISQQSPLPIGFDEAKEIYFRQRIDLSDFVSTSDGTNSLAPRYFKVALDNTKNYAVINLGTMEESQSLKTSYTWKNLKSAYGYKFYFELVKYPAKYLFIKIEPFAKEGKDIPYTFFSIDKDQTNINIEAMSYGEDPYVGFIKNILKIKN